MRKGTLPVIYEEPESQMTRGQELDNSNMILRLITHHYRTQTCSKSEEQLQREKWLLPGVPFSR
ncbi:unnamed protein product, partial [Allacma fusca]